MAENVCTACGANIDIATDVATGRKVALEKFTDASSDAARYRVVAIAPLEVERVSDDAPGNYFPDHAFDCPGQNAGHAR